MTLGDIIKQYRMEHQMSMDKFSKISGLSKAYVGILEKNVNPTTGRPVTPSIVTVKCVSMATGIEFDALLNMLDSDQPISLETVPSTASQEPEVSSDTDPQLDELNRNAQQLNAQGLQKLVDISDDMVTSGKYKKAPLHPDPDDSGA